MKLNHREKLSLICALGLSIGSHYAAHALSSLKKPIIEDLGITNKQYGLIQSAVATVNTILPVFGGILLDSLGLSIGSLLSTILVTLGTGVTAYSAFVHSFSLMVFGRALYGFGSGYVVVAQQTILCSRIFSNSTVTPGIKKGKWMAFTMGIQVAIGRLSGFLAQGTVINLKQYFGHYSAGLVAAFLVSCFSLFLNILYIIFESLDDEKNTSNLRSQTDFRNQVQNKTIKKQVPPPDCPCSQDCHSLPLGDSLRQVFYMAPTSDCCQDEVCSSYGAVLPSIEGLIVEKSIVSDPEEPKYQVVIHKIKRIREESIRDCATNVVNETCLETHSPKKFHPSYILDLSHLFWLVFMLHGLIYGCWTTFLHINADLIHTKYPTHSPESVAWEAAVAQLLPVFLSPVFGGIIDKFGRRSITMAFTALAFLFSILLLTFTNFSPLVSMIVFSISLTLGPVSVISSVPYITALTSDTSSASLLPSTTANDESQPLLTSQAPENNIGQQLQISTPLVQKSVAIGTALGIIKSGANAIAGLMDPFLGGLQDKTSGKTYDLVLRFYIFVGLFAVGVAVAIRVVDRMRYGDILGKNKEEDSSSEIVEPSNAWTWHGVNQRIGKLMKILYVVVWLSVVFIDWVVWINGLIISYWV
ncbi:hypothetical protein HK096_003552 [Nowakowskiella sp. JEL0078]|nr:hypothetical protein HK096_003552 [Nowakowskiella sp. JEL0078]